MRCFYHQDKEAVGLCKSCAKALCAERAIDLGRGLACRSGCEERVRAIIQLLDRELQSLQQRPARTCVTATTARPAPFSPPLAATQTFRGKPSRPWWKFW